MPFFFFESSIFYGLFHVVLPFSLRPTFLPPGWLQTVIPNDSGRKFLVSEDQDRCDCENKSRVALFWFSAVTEVTACILNRRAKVRTKYHWDASVQPGLQRKINKNYTLRFCVCSLRYPAGNAHALYYILWAVRFYNIFPRYFINGRISEKEKSMEYEMCVSICSTNFVWYISHCKKNWARRNQKIYIGLHVKCPSFLSDFNETSISSTDFRKILKYHISWKSVQYEPSCSMQTNARIDGHTHMMELIVALRNFANVPKKTVKL